MKTLERINALITKINAIEIPPSIHSVCCYPSNNEGSIEADEQILAALQDGTLQICVDVECFRTHSQRDEMERDADLLKLKTKIESEGGSLSPSGSGSGSYGPVECFTLCLPQ